MNELLGLAAAVLVMVGVAIYYLRKHLPQVQEQGGVLADAEPGLPLQKLLTETLKRDIRLKILGKGPDGPIYCFLCSGAQAVKIWEKLRAGTEDHGYWPLILGNASDDNLTLMQEALELIEGDPAGVPVILEKAAALDLADWWQTQSRDIFEEAAPFADLLEGEWPDEDEPDTELTIHLNDESHKPLKQVAIAMLPTRTSWEVPAYMGYGGWNECPFPHEHVAVMKHWYERYGAELVGMTSDVIEMRVARPPQDRESALALAKEQCLYCSDIVYQGTESIEALAATLINGTVWYFWWD